jgi:hypothetical protein
MKSRVILLLVISCSFFIFNCGKEEGGTKNNNLQPDKINTTDRNIPQEKQKNLAEFKDRFIKLKQVKIYDYNGFAQPEVAYTFLLPEGWKTSGGIKWNGNAKCITEYVTNRLHAESPDGKLSFDMFPIKTYEWMNDETALQMAEYSRQTPGQGCMLHQPMNASQFISEVFIPEIRPGAQKIKIVKTSGAANAAREKSSREIKEMLQSYNVDLKTDAVIATIRYKDQNSVRNEWITTSIIQYSYSLPSAMNYGSYYTYFTTTADDIMSFSAPEGELEKNEKLFSTIMASFHLNPVWERAINNFFNNMANIQLKGAMDRSRIWSNAMNEIGNMQYQSWQQREQSQDKIAQNWSQYMRGVETYFDPNTNTSVELSSGYNQAWSDNNGNYILSEDPNFNPNEYFTKENWGLLKKKEN